MEYAKWDQETEILKKIKGFLKFEPLTTKDLAHYLGVRKKIAQEYIDKLKERDAIYEKCIDGKVWYGVPSSVRIHTIKKKKVKNL